MLRTLIVSALLAAALAGCAAESKIDLPEAFVQLNRDQTAWEFDMQAVSADGVVLATRRQDNNKNGTLAFWSQAVQNELTGVKGYTLVKADDVRTSLGTPAKRMEFKADRAGVAYGYIVLLIVDQKNVRLAEAGGPADKMTQHAEAVEKALLSLRQAEWNPARRTGR